MAQTRKDLRGRVLRKGESQRRSDERYVYTYTDPLGRRKYVYAQDLVTLIQFNFPDENGNPYHSSGGQLVWNKNLQQEIPQDWRSGNLYDIADYRQMIAKADENMQESE